LIAFVHTSISSDHVDSTHGINFHKFINQSDISIFNDGSTYALIIIDDTVPDAVPGKLSSQFIAES